ncbi:helix-turn-helix domain-containing protein [Baileyella intestinalis]|uniref:helix-turn-helix domain-containing protein n=1 Tax=Baileyella intestinalis TaxID=2606709 RepID=UPI003A84378C
MTDTEALRAAIDKSGFKRTYIAKVAGLSYQGYLNKEGGKSEFKQSEIDAICHVLGLSLQEKQAIFFAQEVD